MKKSKQFYPDNQRVCLKQAKEQIVKKGGGWVIAFFKSLIRGFNGLSLGLALLLLVIVAFNIVARIIHDFSAGTLSFMIPGAIELSRYTLLLLVFAALPNISISEMVRVDLVSNHLPVKFAIFLNQIWLILLALFMAVLVWLFVHKAMLTFNRGDATQDLQIPLYYFYAAISVSCATTIVSIISQIFTQSVHNRSILNKSTLNNKATN